MIVKYDTIADVWKVGSRYVDPHVILCPICHTAMKVTKQYPHTDDEKISMLGRYHKGEEEHYMAKTNTMVEFVMQCPSCPSPVELHFTMECSLICDGTELKD